MMDWHSFLHVNRLPLRRRKGPPNIPRSPGLAPILQSGSSFTKERMDNVAPAWGDITRIKTNFHHTMHLSLCPKHADTGHSQLGKPVNHYLRTYETCGYGMGVTAWHMMARVTCLSLLVGRVPWQQVQQQFPLPTPRGISPAPRGLHVLAFAPPDSLR